MSAPVSPTHKTTNWAYHNAALKRRRSLTVWFDLEMNWDAEASGKRGRSRTFSDAAIQTCLTMKVLFGMALRQTTGFVEILLRLTGLDWPVPDFSTICRRQSTLAVNIPYRGAKGPLHLLIDSPASRLKGKANGTLASMAAPNDVSGARSTLVSTSKHRRSEPARSRAAKPGMHRCCLICSTRSRAIRRLVA